MPITDTFTASNGTDIGALTNWSRTLGNSGDLSIQQNQIQILDDAANNDVVAVRTDGTFPNDQYSQIQITRVQGLGQYAGPAVRMSLTNDGYMFRVNMNGGSVVANLYRMDAGTRTQLGSQTTATTAVNDLLKLDATGTTLTPTINGSTTGTPGAQTDATYSSGRPGLYAHTRDVSTNKEGRLDNFECSDLAATNVTETPATATWAQWVGQSLTEILNEQIEAGTWAAFSGQSVSDNQNELVDAATWAVFTGQSLTDSAGVSESVDAATWAALSGQAVYDNGNELVGAAAWAPITGQSVYDNENELINAATWAVFTGQSLTELTAVSEAVDAGVMAAWSGQSFFYSDAEQPGVGSWAVLAGQDVYENLNELLGTGTWAVFVGQEITEAGAISESIGAGTLAVFVGQDFSENQSEAPDVGIWPVFSGQSVTELTEATESPAESVWAVFAGGTLGVNIDEEVEVSSWPIWQGQVYIVTGEEPLSIVGAGDLGGPHVGGASVIRSGQVRWLGPI